MYQETLNQQHRADGGDEISGNFLSQIENTSKPGWI